MDKDKRNKQRNRASYGSIDGFLKPHSTSRVAPINQQKVNLPLPIATSSLNLPTNPLLPKPSVPVNLPTPLPIVVRDPVIIPAHGKNKRARKQKVHKKLTKKKLVLRSVLVLVLLIIGVGGFLGLRGLNTIDKVFHGNIITDAQALFSSTPLKGESTGRVNILLAGDSTDDPGHAGSSLTDSILVLSVDTQNHTAFLLSIPRDLWVDIPGVGWQKINAANNDLGTNFPGYPQNGMGQLEHLVVTDLGIPINYYALSDYGAFKDAVDAVGGVTVDIQSPDPRGLYDPNTNLNLPNGPDALDGQEALNLARARGDGYGSYGFPDSDFDRTEHQRQIFTAITQKAETIGVLSNPVRISELFSAFSNNVQTDLSLQNVLRLVQITKGINLSKISSYSYCSTLSAGSDGCTKPILTDYTDPASGEEALIPEDGLGEYGQLQQYYEQLTSDNPLVKEGANVVILNASDVIGLAKTQEGILEAKGVNVAAIADANNEYPSTMIIDESNGKMPDTLKQLQQLYPGKTVITDTSPTEATEAQGYTADFVVVLGQNWDSSQ
jgi:LCP family protein required for cell wall assembly